MPNSVGNAPLYGVSGISDAGSGDPSTDLIMALMPYLNAAPPARPAKPGMGQDVSGSLGDALASMASVRSGKGILPIGPYGASLARQQQEYQKQLMENKRANDMLKRQLMIGLVGEGGKERVAEIIAQASGNRSRASNDARIEAARIAAEGRVKAAETGAAARASKPEGVTLKDLQSGFIGKFDKQGNYLGFATDESGKPLRTKEGQSAAGMQVQIDNALDALHNTRDTYNKLQSYSLGEKTVGSIGQGITENHPSLRGIVEEKTAAGEDAILHDQNINVLSGLVVRPLTNTVRAQGLMDVFKSAAPRATDTPRVANNFYNQMEGFLQRAKTLPWGTDPERAESEYESGAIRTLRSWRTSAAAPSGKTLAIPEDEFQSLRSKRQAGKMLNGDEMDRYKAGLEERVSGQ